MTCLLHAVAFPLSYTHGGEEEVGMRTIGWLAALAFLWVASVNPASGEDEEPQVMVWEGYLYRGKDGRTHLGWPVVAMGVLTMPSHVVEGSLTERLGPLVSRAEDQYVFWNYDLERGAEHQARLPRILVRLEGPVTHVGDGNPRVRSSSAGERRMTDPRLTEVEIVPDAWLEHWAVFFREKASPFQIRLDRKKPTPAERRAFARLALATLTAMRRVPGAQPAEKRPIAAIDSNARVVDRFRRSTELGILRWLHEERGALADVDWTGLDALGPVPPTSLVLQRLFLDAAGKKDFLAAVRKKWSGTLDLLELPYYVTDDRGSTSYTTVDLGRLERSWSDADYALHRKTTRGIVGR